MQITYLTIEETADLIERIFSFSIVDRNSSEDVYKFTLDGVESVLIHTCNRNYLLEVM